MKMTNNLYMGEKWATNCPNMGINLEQRKEATNTPTRFNCLNYGFPTNSTHHIIVSALQFNQLLLVSSSPYYALWLRLHQQEYQQH